MVTFSGAPDYRGFRMLSGSISGFSRRGLNSFLLTIHRHGFQLVHSVPAQTEKGRRED